MNVRKRKKSAKKKKEQKEHIACNIEDNIKLYLIQRCYPIVIVMDDDLDLMRKFKKFW